MQKGWRAQTIPEGNNCIYTVISFVVNWSFSNIDLEMEKNHINFADCFVSLKQTFDLHPLFILINEST